MNLVAIVLLLQLTVVLPQRSSLTNPAVDSAVPKQLQKDYDRIWDRFLKGKEDAKVLSETESLLKKNGQLLPVLMIQFYVHQYAGRTSEAERKLEEVLRLRPLDRMALNALADTAYDRKEFIRASNLYTTLLTIERSRPDLETRRQKSLLLAVESLLMKGRQALEAGSLAAAEQSYREALSLAPGEASLHGELASVLMRREKWEEALTEYQRQVELGGSTEQARQGLALALGRLGLTGDAFPGPDKPAEASATTPRADLEELGRWGPEIDRFKSLASSDALTRGEFSWMLYRYFPRLSELPQTPYILTDVQGTGADREIQAVAGLGLLDPMPNHTFQPSRTLNRREFAQAMARLSRLLMVFPIVAATEPKPAVASTTTALQDVELAASLGLLASADPVNSDLSGPTRGEEAVNAAEKLLSVLSEKRP